MCGEQKGCQESQGDVFVVEDVGIIVSTAFSYAEENPVEQRNVVKQVGVGKGGHTQEFAELWALAFRESLHDVMIIL